MEIIMKKHITSIRVWVCRYQVSNLNSTTVYCGWSFARRISALYFEIGHDR